MLVDALYADLRDKLDLLRQLELELNLQTLRALVVRVLWTRFSEAYHVGMMHSATKITVISKIKS